MGRALGIHTFITTSLGVLLALGACARSGGADNQPVPANIRPDELPPSGGIPPDKEAEIMLVLQQREVSTRKCYQDVLNEKQDRNCQGNVKVVIALGTTGEAQNVRVAGTTLNNKEVEDCLVGTIRRFEFPPLAQSGEVQYEFRFRPAY
jgi:hypothetical protein